MSGKKTEDGTGSEIIYHFDVEQHRLPLTLSIETEQATKDILDDFNHQFFGGKLKYSLYVVPSEEGGFVKVFRIILVSSGILGSAAVGGTEIMNNLGQFLDTNMGESMYEKYKGEPLPWLKDTIDKNDIDHQSDEGTQSYKMDEPTEKFLVNCLTNMPAYFLSQDIVTLANNNITTDNFPKAFEARNKFYNSCIDNEEVRGIAFDRSYDSWIKRERFEGLTVDLPDNKYFLKQRLENLRVGIPDSKYFKHDTVDIVVISPNSKRKGRGWQTSESITFHIDDEKFWENVNNKTITPRVQDKMQVQWIYEYNKTRPQKVRVLKVISYKGKKISEPLSKEEIQKICDDKTRASNEDDFKD